MTRPLSISCGPYDQMVLCRGDHSISIEPAMHDTPLYVQIIAIVSKVGLITSSNHTGDQLLYVKQGGHVNDNSYEDKGGSFPYILYLHS